MLSSYQIWGRGTRIKSLHTSSTPLLLAAGDRDLLSLLCCCSTPSTLVSEPGECFAVSGLGERFAACAETPPPSPPPTTLVAPRYRADQPIRDQGVAAAVAAAVDGGGGGGCRCCCSCCDGVLFSPLLHAKSSHKAPEQET